MPREMFSSISGLYPLDPPLVTINIISRRWQMPPSPWGESRGGEGYFPLKTTELDLNAGDEGEPGLCLNGQEVTYTRQLLGPGDLLLHYWWYSGQGEE